jgi:glycosyltransferase involved in cell wall biosynthesis
MPKLKIRTQGMFGTEHSWSVTMRNLFAAFEKMGHDLYINTTNGIDGVPKKWFKYFRDCTDPDIDICYTLPINFPHRFAAKARCKLGIYNYESSILPPGWADYHKYVDYILPSSEYCKDIFINAGIPNEKLFVLPLGIDFDLLNSPHDKLALQTKKRFKLLNVSIPHMRKNIPALIDAYLKEFSASDDICLVIKSSATKIEDANYEINVVDMIRQVTAENVKKFPDKLMPEIELVDFKFVNMATIYTQCDALINVASSEGFGLPLLEAMACNKIVAAPDFGGVKDFLNVDNSLVIDAMEIYAPPAYQYWYATKGATISFPISESMQKVMRNLYENKEELHKKFEKNMKATVAKYTWDNAANIVTNLLEKGSFYEIGELI